ncbi:MAG: hypothetical protein U9R04_05200 [Chloroflexota bacterium]|nr:hypothetical protein [Chloroflexota bacterium]
MRLTKARLSVVHPAFVDREPRKAKRGGLLKIGSCAPQQGLFYFVDEHLIVIILNYVAGRRCAGAQM